MNLASARFFVFRLLPLYFCTLFFQKLFSFLKHFSCCYLPAVL
ncbi:hypothetical protein ESA_03759 [Cronobacter sakazakii ATCC BAA-894]|uniref:Uncharacterized protein n=1 Tax=Cronobacter sakazakii (strain ATCC BAA-894) TaxID=290339 RepID=A7MQJ6_CROS8|nr:hypothetical protein ESA_03759 [Cronobacter sakazakii ATCC BAA-894]